MFFLRRSRPTLLGVDISSSSVKLVELADSSTGVEFKGYAIAMLKSLDAAAGQDLRIQAVGTAIKKALRQMGSRTVRSVTAVPSPAVIVKTLSFPDSLTEDEIEAQIELESEQYIPYPLEDVSLDFSIIGPSDTTPGSLDVRVVASRRDQVEDRAAALEWAGLKPEVVDVESFAMERACSRLVDEAWLEGPDSQAYAVCDLGAVSTSLVVIRDRQVIFTREQTFGGLQLSHDIQKYFGLTLDEAEGMKRYGGLPADYQSEVMTPFVELLAQQVKRSLLFFLSSQGQFGLKRIFLAGGCASLPGLIERVASLGDTPVTVIDPLVRMKFADRSVYPNLVADAPSLLVATGLALRCTEPDMK